jgi:hypothetical protein
MYKPCAVALWNRKAAQKKRLRRSSDEKWHLVGADGSEHVTKVTFCGGRHAVSRVLGGGLEVGATVDGLKDTKIVLKVSNEIAADVREVLRFLLTSTLSSHRASLETFQFVMSTAPEARNRAQAQKKEGQLSGLLQRLCGFLTDSSQS